MKDLLSHILNQLAENVPTLLILCLVTGAFLLYLDRHDSREDARAELERIVAQQRIDRCHDVQDDGVHAMEKLADSLDTQAEALMELKISIQSLQRLMETMPR